jgi:hypothetical protein
VLEQDIVAALVAGRMTPEAVRAAEADGAVRVDDTTGRRLFGEALQDALVDAGADWPAEGERRLHALMGAVMRRLRGRVPGRLVCEGLGVSLKEVRP